MNKDTNSFLGQGWAFPPSFSTGGREVALVSGDEDIQQSLQILLGTSLRERIMQSDFGASMNKYLFEEMDQAFTTSIKEMIRDAILRNESRISLDQVDLSNSDTIEGLLLIQITYRVKSTNSRYNMVYPFYLNEATS